MTATGHSYEKKLEALITLARVDFGVFVQLMHPPTHEDFIFSDVHVYLATLLQAVVDGEAADHNIVSMPPQHGKSTVLTKLGSAWVLGRCAGISVAITAFSQSLVEDFSTDVKTYVCSEVYQLIFPNTAVVYGHDKASKWKMHNGSSMTAKGAGSKLTGRRVDFLIVDDPYSGREAAESVTVRKKIRQWFEADCLTRLSPNAKTFIIATRWHPDDLTGYMTSEEKIAELKAHKKEDRIYALHNLKALSDGADDDPIRRPAGAALFPEERDKEFLLGIKAVMPPYEWNSQYQGEPSTSTGGQVDIKKLHYIDLDELPEGLDMARGWDFAVEDNALSDYHAGALLGLLKPSEEEAKAAKDKKLPPPLPWLYIVHMSHLKTAWITAKKKAIEHGLDDAATYESVKVGVEGVAGFGAAVQEIRAALIGRSPVYKKNPAKGGKLSRAQKWFNLIEAGRVVIVRGSWNKGFVEELKQFPAGTYDDQVDAVSIAYETVVVPAVLIA